MQEKKEDKSEKLNVDFFIKEIQQLRDKTESIGGFRRKEHEFRTEDKKEELSDKPISKPVLKPTAKPIPSSPIASPTAARKIKIIRTIPFEELENIKIYEKIKHQGTFRDNKKNLEIPRLPEFPTNLKRDEISTKELIDSYVSRDKFLPQTIVPAVKIEAEEEEDEDDYKELKNEKNKEIRDEDKKKLVEFFEVGKKVINKLPRDKGDYYRKIKDDVEDKHVENKNIQEASPEVTYEKKVEELKLPEVRTAKLVRKTKSPQKIYLEYPEFSDIVRSFDDIKNISSSGGGVLSDLSRRKEMHEHAIAHANFDLETLKKGLDKVKSLVPVQIE